MAAKRRKIVAEDFDLGYNATTIPTDSGGVRAASQFNLASVYSDRGYSSLPTAGIAGRVSRVNDGVRGLWLDTGTQWISVSGDVVNVKEYGAKGDGRYVNNAAITSGLTTLTSATAAFTSRDIGKSVVVIGAAASSATLAATITAVASATSATLSVAAGATVSGALLLVVSDDTAAFTLALAAGLNVFMPAGFYGLTTLRLRQQHTMIGAGILSTSVWRLDASTAAAFVAMTSGQTAEHMYLAQFGVWCNSFGTALNGVELGTETPGTTDFANGSLMDTVRIFSATGIGLYLYSNAGQARNIGVQNNPSTGTPTGLSMASSQGMKVSGSTFVGYNIHIEGRFENGELINDCGGSNWNTLHFEVSGVYAKDSVTISNNPTHMEDLTFLIHAGAAATRRDLIRINSGIVFASIRSVYIVNTSFTTTNALNDITQSVTISAAQVWIPQYDSMDASNTIAINLYPKTGIIGAVTAVPSTGVLMGGVYTPTLTNATNVAASTAYQCQYMRVGSVITVSGKVDIDVTAAGGTTLGLSLPVGSAIAAEEDCGGVACAPSAGVAGEQAAIRGNVAGGRADINFIAVDTANRSWYFSFTYRVI